MDQKKQIVEQINKNIAFLFIVTDNNKRSE